MTQDQWTHEVLDALDGTGWRACSARLSEGATECYAQVIHNDGRLHLIQMELRRFVDPVDRAIEIRRQLGYATLAAEATSAKVPQGRH